MKYLQTYLRICTSAKYRGVDRTQVKQLMGYVELHHILPKGFKLGGYKDEANLVFLTAREHFICHKLLVFASKGTKFYNCCVTSMYFFVKSGPNTSRSILSSYDFEFVRKHHSLIMTGINNPRYGGIYPAPNKGIPMKEEQKQLLRNQRLGTKQSKETIRRRTLKTTGKIRPKSPCLICGQLCAANTLKQWHNDNCKLK